MKFVNFLNKITYSKISLLKINVYYKYHSNKLLIKSKNYILNYKQINNKLLIKILLK